MTDAEDMNDPFRTAKARRLADLSVRNARRAAWTVTGVAGVVIGHILVGILKAVFDTITADADRLAAQNDGEAAVFGNGKAEAEP